jgi:hypothetical protein
VIERADANAERQENQQWRKSPYQRVHRNDLYSPCCCADGLPGRHCG